MRSFLVATPMCSRKWRTLLALTHDLFLHCLWFMKNAWLWKPFATLCAPLSSRVNASMFSFPVFSSPLLSQAFLWDPCWLTPPRVLVRWWRSLTRQHLPASINMTANAHRCVCMYVNVGGRVAECNCLFVLCLAQSICLLNFVCTYLWAVFSNSEVLLFGDYSSVWSHFAVCLHAWSVGAVRLINSSAALSQGL